MAEISRWKGWTVMCFVCGFWAGAADALQESLVQEKLRAAIPALKQVVLVTGVSDALLEQARQLLQERHSS